MRYVSLFLMVLVFAVSPCLCGCEESAAPDNVESIGDSTVDEGAPAHVETDPDDV